MGGPNFRKGAGPTTPDRAKMKQKTSKRHPSGPGDLPRGGRNPGTGRGGLRKKQKYFSRGKKKLEQKPRENRSYQLPGGPGQGKGGGKESGVAKGGLPKVGRPAGQFIPGMDAWNFYRFRKKGRRSKNVFVLDSCFPQPHRQTSRFIGRREKI